MMKFPHEEGKNGMSLKKYEAFVRTVELGSLTRAAEAMGSTQSRISHVLSALEEEYGFVLLRRNRSGVRLTEAGAMVLPKMQEILQKDRELTELIGDIRSADAGTVRLGAFTSVAVHWLPGMIRTFQSAHPKAELKMFNGDYHDMEQWLREGEVDIGFVTLPAPEENAVNMMAAAEKVATGLITYAARDSEFDGRPIRKGEIMALENGKIVATGSDITKMTYRLARSMKKKDSQFITVISGAEVSEEDAEHTTELVQSKCGSSVEVSHIHGGQPVYYYMLSVE